MVDLMTRPQRTRTAYSERQDLSEGPLSRTATRCRLLNRRHAYKKSLRDLTSRIRAHGALYERCDDEALRTTARHLQRLLHTRGVREELAIQAFALVREVASRTLGQRPYDVQLEAGWALLHGFACEMETGEGKTLTATLPACTAALSGLHVHVVTVNDYLAERDAAEMAAIYRGLGLTVGLVTREHDFAERQHAYSCAVTYCTNKELTFDYLRDRVTLGADASQLHLQIDDLAGQPQRRASLLLQGLEFAIVDELDSVLIDEAQTPLILSQKDPTSDPDAVYHHALSIADTLRVGDDYTLDSAHRRVQLTDQGRALVDRAAQELGPVAGAWQLAAHREERVRQALSARTFYLRDRDYILRDDKVVIVDANTGRAVPDRSWQQGLHQAVEAREGCPLTEELVPMARISYQKFFRRYQRLAGMTGTAHEVRGELQQVYRLETVRIRTHRPSQRKALPPLFFATAQEKWCALAEQVQEIHGCGRPILIGTRSVATSELVAEHLALHGLQVRVLNARQDHAEAEVVAAAGAAGAITVATDMAGRGTDIQISEQVQSRGGLHVISVELHESQRIERQLFGRCGRQGEPGTHQSLVSLEDELIERQSGPLARKVSAMWGRASRVLPHWIFVRLARHAQRVTQAQRRKIRQRLLAQDERTEELLAFAGEENSSQRQRYR